MVNALNEATGAVLQQHVNNSWQHLAFFLNKASTMPEEIRYLWERVVSDLHHHKTFSSFHRRSCVPRTCWPETTYICFKISERQSYASQDSSHGFHTRIHHQHWARKSVRQQRGRRAFPRCHSFAIFTATSCWLVSASTWTGRGWRAQKPSCIFVSSYFWGNTSNNWRRGSYFPRCRPALLVLSFHQVSERKFLSLYMACHIHGFA